MVDRFFHFTPSKNTAMVLLLGVLSVAASFAAGLSTSSFGFTLWRDLIQVILLGILLPAFIMNREAAFVKAGIRFDRPLRYVLISTALGTLLFIQFALEPGTSLQPLNSNLLNGAVYVVVTNIFEIFFFTCFLRHYFEEALGIVPAILLAAAAYSFHHAGFQPEYLKLFLVGLFFISIFRIANHWLVLFPLWWVGGLGDVLFRSPATMSVDWSGSWIKAVVILSVFIGVMIKLYPGRGTS